MCFIPEHIIKKSGKKIHFGYACFSLTNGFLERFFGNGSTIRNWVAQPYQLRVHLLLSLAALSWVFNNDNGSAANCAQNCANNCANNAENNSDFRGALFSGSGSFWDKVLPTCGTKCYGHFSDVTTKHLFHKHLLNIRWGCVTCLNANNVLTNIKRRGRLDW